jgi:hypothetical protein
MTKALEPQSVCHVLLVTDGLHFLDSRLLACHGKNGNAPKKAGPGRRTAVNNATTAPAWHVDNIKLIRERCKCDYQAINAANLPKEQADEIKDETITAELARRRGKTILVDLVAKAEKRWRGRIEPKEKK